MRRNTIHGVAVAAAALALAPGAAVGQLPSIDEQIAGAILPLPADQRPTATVLGYRTEGVLSVIRQGSGDMICLADAPWNDSFHAACYHESLEPMMALGRALSARGLGEAERDSARAAAAADGSLPMPDGPAAFHSITAPIGSWDAEARVLADGAKLHTLYVPFATAETTGLSTMPAGNGQPWLMFPGSYRAHIMIQPPRGTGGG